MVGGRSLNSHRAEARKYDGLSFFYVQEKFFFASEFNGCKIYGHKRMKV